MNLTDADLALRVRQGDLSAYAELMARHRPWLGRYAYHLLGNREDAEDVLQEAFVRAHRALVRGEDPRRFGAWMLTIVVNRCRSRRARWDPIERGLDGEQAYLRASVDHPAEQAAWREEIRQALARLVPEQREAFLLKYVMEMSYEEMAEVTGVGASALKMRVKRACDRLRGLLGEVYRG